MMDRIKLLVTILDRGRGSRAVELYAAAGIRHHCALPGLGTANSDLLDYLGLGETGKDVILTLLPEGQIPPLFQAAREVLQLSRPGNGILFVMPLSAISRSAAQYLNQGLQAPKQKEAPMEQGKHRLIVVMTDHGCTDTVMAAAKAAGARGGTLLHGRRMSCDESGGEGRVRPERELVAILVPRDLQGPVMESINRAAGAATECHGVLFSLPVDEAAGLPGLR